MEKGFRELSIKRYGTGFEEFFDEIFTTKKHQKKGKYFTFPLSKISIATKRLCMYNRNLGIRSIVKMSDRYPKNLRDSLKKVELFIYI